MTVAPPDLEGTTTGPTNPDRITLRFMVSPRDIGASGTSVAAGSVLEWIDKAGYACAVGWSRAYCVTAYVGNVHFTHSIAPGEMVEVHARIIHTGRTSMQVLVSVDTSDVRDRDWRPATHCILVFVAVDESGRPQEVPTWHPTSAADHDLQVNAVERLEARREIHRAMREQTYTGEGTTPRTVFRFLADPADANYGGKTHGGTVMRWIDEAAFACAAGWSSDDAVAVYSGGIHFYRPISIGHIVEVDARLIHTGPRSMHISIHVRSGSTRTPDALELTTQCMSIFVDRGSDGRASGVRMLTLESDEDHRLAAHARALAAMRAELTGIQLSSRV